MSRDAERAVLLLSGGLDSATVLAMARQQGYQVYALTVDYHQRHRGEILAARELAEAAMVAAHRIVSLDLSVFGGSALTDASIAVPQGGEESGIPVTYVPARNTIFLSLALAWAEVLESFTIFTGVNAVDYSGYPDCRPAFIRAFQDLAMLATKAGVEGGQYRILTPLIDKSKAQIIQIGTALGVNYGKTVSCYALDAQNRACGACDACRLRRQGFSEAGVKDPTEYVQQPS